MGRELGLILNTHLAVIGGMLDERGMRFHVAFLIIDLYSEIMA